MPHYSRSLIHACRSEGATLALRKSQGRGVIECRLIRRREQPHRIATIPSQRRDKRFTLHPSALPIGSIALVEDSEPPADSPASV